MGTTGTNDRKTRCETVDQTFTWTDQDGNLNIREGDLISEFGIGFALVSAVDLIEDGRVVRYKLDGQLGAAFADPKDEVTVHRYIETTEE